MPDSDDTQHKNGRADRPKIRFPDSEAELDQDEEWFEFEQNGRWRRLRVHDYAEMYEIPGLYEALVYDKLECRSPRRLRQLLEHASREAHTFKAEELRVLDLGAGNGIVAEELRRIGVDHVVGLDLLPEAARAARRDRPAVYDDYVVADLCDLTDRERQRLLGHRLNFLITVAALGFGDIPPAAFATAFNLVESKGWLALTIKEDFLDEGEITGFARLVDQMIDRGILDVQAFHRYRHRLSLAGEPLF
ncbi:MAG: methyltransferase domain-containing protein, partial [Gemmatimonadota bacterium]